MNNFDFISDEEFRWSLESDDKEVAKCMEAGAWKAVHVLVGSMIEAILADYLLTTDQTLRKDDVLKMDLGKLIEICAKQHALTPKTVGLSIAVKTYRNLIHPGRVIRLQEKVDENGAKVAYALLHMVADEISAKKTEKCGLTAEQLVDKVICDPSSLPILTHLLTETSERESRRLLLKVLPDRYFTMAADPGDIFGEALPHLAECFRKAFELASDDTKSQVLTKFVSILKRESESRVRTYDDEFCRASYLAYVSPEDRQIVKDHLLSRLAGGVTLPLLNALEGIGKFLDAGETNKLIDPLIKAAVRGNDEALRKAARNGIVIAWSETGSGTKTEEAINKRLRAWVAHYESKNRALVAELVRQINEECSPVPF